MNVHHKLFLLSLCFAVAGCGPQVLSDQDAPAAVDEHEQDEASDEHEHDEAIDEGETFAEDGALENGVANKPAVFIVPHQDDEILTMGAGLVQHIDAGRDVWVVLVTNGKSRLPQLMCERGNICITVDEFSRARDREFLAALNKLGVRRDHVIFLNHDKVTPQIAIEVIDFVVRRFGADASFKTMSFLDRHPDHRELGLALDRRSRARRISDARFYQFDDYAGQAPLPKGGVIPDSAYDTAKLHNAGLEYRYVNHGQGRYGIGAVWSVPGTFKRFYAGNTLYRWHMDGHNWRSTADRLAAEAWIARVGTF